WFRRQRPEDHAQGGAKDHRNDRHKTIPETDVPTRCQEEDFERLLALANLPDDIAGLMGILQDGEIDETCGRKERCRQRAPFRAALPKKCSDHHWRHSRETREGVTHSNLEDALLLLELQRDQIRGDGHKDNESASEMDRASFSIFLAATVALVNIFGEHGAECQNLVSVRTHDGG